MNRTHIINISNKEETPDKIGIVSMEGWKNYKRTKSNKVAR